MADRPIIFSAPMVRALLDGRKTQTRRLLKNMPPKPAMDNVVHGARHAEPYLDAYCGERKTAANPRGMSNRWAWWTRDDRPGPLFRVPAAPGDRLYVREAWSHTGDGVFEISQARMLGRGGVIYRADENPKWPHAKYWPSLHMPREFSRLTLIVEGLKVERLHECSEADAKAEGLSTLSKDGGRLFKYGIPDRDGLPGNDNDGWHWHEWEVDPRAAYARLWNSLHTKPGERWEDNPWVVAVTFRVERGNIDQIRTEAA